MHAFLACLVVRNMNLQHRLPVDSECPELLPFPGSHQQQPGPAPAPGSLTTCVALSSILSLPTPHPQQVLACPWHVKYLRKHVTKPWQIQRNYQYRVKASAVAATSARVLPVVSADRARPAWQRPHGCWRSVRSVITASYSTQPAQELLERPLDRIPPLRGLRGGKEACTGSSWH